ncbi:hypothetical protein DUNSADRAFT_14416, partial [Dunaliella salina]
MAKLEREAERLDQLAVTQQRLKESQIQAAKEAAEKAQQWLKKGMERVRRNMAKVMCTLKSCGVASRKLQSRVGVCTRRRMVAAQNKARRTQIEARGIHLRKVLTPFDLQAGKLWLHRGREVVAAQNEARRTAVIGLKDNLARVRDEVAHKAALYRQLQKQKQEVQDKEFQDLIERGLNPYEIHRKKDMEAQVTRQRAALQERIVARKMLIAEQLAKEEAAHQRELQAQEAERQAAIQFQREMGRAASEARTDEYMKNTTVNHSVLLDPTGRMPVHPSQAVVAKTNTFGSGRSTQALLDRMTQKHPDIKAKDLLVPVKYRSVEEEDSEEETSDESLDNGRIKPAMTERSGYTTATGFNIEFYAQASTFSPMLRHRRRVLSSGFNTATQQLVNSDKKSLDNGNVKPKMMEHSGFTQQSASQFHASDQDYDLGVREKSKCSYQNEIRLGAAQEHRWLELPCVEGALIYGRAGAVPYIIAPCSCPINDCSLHVRQGRLRKLAYTRNGQEGSLIPKASTVPGLAQSLELCLVVVGAYDLGEGVPQIKELPESVPQVVASCSCLTICGTSFLPAAVEEIIDLTRRFGGDWKQLETRKLSKLERSMLEAAKTRHKEGIAAPKHQERFMLEDAKTRHKEGIAAQQSVRLGIRKCLDTTKNMHKEGIAALK